MFVKVSKTLTLQNILEHLLKNNVEFSYLGSQGCSTYLLSSLNCELTSSAELPEVELKVEVDATHLSGTFCSKKELEESLSNQLDALLGWSDNGPFE